MDPNVPPTPPPSPVHLYDEEGWYIGDQNPEEVDITDSEDTMSVEAMTNDTDSGSEMSQIANEPPVITVPLPDLQDFVETFDQLSLEHNRLAAENQMLKARISWLEGRVLASEVTADLYRYVHYCTYQSQLRRIESLPGLLTDPTVISSL